MNLFKLFFGILLTGTGFFSAGRVHAASGTWTNDASSVWSDTTSWVGGVIADGADATADFSTVAITASRTVTLDSSRNLGNLLFGNPATPSTTNWTLAASGGSVLNLAVSSGSPTITVTNTAALNVPLAGVVGLTKAGNGTLILGGSNTYSGATTVSVGTLKLTNNASTTGPVLYLSFNNVGGNIVTNTGSGGAAMNGLIVGSGVSVGSGGPNGNNALSVGSGAVNAGYVLINSSVVPLNNAAAWTVGMWMKTSTTGAVYAYQGDGGWGSGNTIFHLNAGTNDQAGAFAGGVRWGQGFETGTTNLTDGNWHFVVMTCSAGTKISYVDGNVDGWSFNQWSSTGTGSQFWIGGTPNIADGDVRLNGQLAEVYVYNRTLSQAEVQALMTAAGPALQQPIPAVSSVAVAASSKFDLNGVSPSIAGLTGSGTVDTTLPTGTNQLVINNTSAVSFGGVITNSSGVLSLHKTGSGMLTLSGANTYTGNTYVDSGTLNINNASAIGTAGTLAINGGTIDNSSGAAVTVVNNKAMQWAGDFTFAGTTNLSFGTDTVNLTGPGSNRVATISSNTLTIGALAVLANSSGMAYGLTKAGAGTLLLSGTGASSIAGGILAVNGGVIQISQDLNSAAGLTGTGTIETSGTGVNKWLWINGSVDSTFSGTIQSYPGTTGRGLGLNKNGSGTLTLNGSATYNDTTTIQAGTLSLVGTGILITNTANAALIGSTTSKAVLQISGGASFFENYNSGAVYNNSIGVGSVANALAAIQMSSGTLTCNRQLNLAYAAGAYAAYTQSGGTATVGGFLAMGVNGGKAVVNHSGGSFTMTGGPATIGAAATGVGVLNLSGNAAFTNTTSGDNGLWFGESGTGTLNIFDNASLTLASANNGIELGRNSGAKGTANLLGGTVTTKTVYTGTSAATSILNFNGGTLKANVANASFVTGLTAAYVYGGGAVIDDGGFAITLGQTLQAPSGYGVVSIPVISGGSNYFDTPVVTITNISASGSGATAVANVSGGAITSITVTCPGQGYGSGDILGVSVVGAGGSGAVIGAPVLGANTSGGVTKLGSGTLTLASGNTYTGSTRILAGTLNLSSGIWSTPTDLIVSNATAAVDASSGSALNVANLTLQDNAVVSLSYGNLSANPSFVALNVNGSLSAPGTNITINVSALGLKPGTFTLIQYTGGALPNLSNFSLKTSAGIAAVLVNNTANDSIDITVNTAPQALTWYGNNDNNWDINTTLNWNNGSSYYLQYTNGSTIVGDAVTFDDTLYNQQNTNVNLTTGLYPYPLVLNSTLPYSFTGSGAIAGSGSIIKSNTGSLMIGTANSYSGGTYIYGGSVIITNDSALGASSGGVTLSGGILEAAANVTNSRPISVVGSSGSGLTIDSGFTMQLGGSISGAGTLNHNSGNLVLTGTNTAASVINGTLNVPATGKITTTAGTVTVGNLNGNGGILNVSGGLVSANPSVGQFTPTLQAGISNGASGDIRLASGTVTASQQIALGIGNGGYGGLTMSGGSLNSGSYTVVGASGDTAVLNQSSGTFTVLTNCLTIAAGNSNSVSVGTFSGGTFIATNSTSGNNGGRGGVFVGEFGNGVMNVMGSAALTLNGDVNVSIGRQVNSSGTVNLLGGSIATAQVSGGSGNAVFNFNGGTLIATTNNTAFMSGLNKSAVVYNSGAIINDGGFSIKITSSLLQPTGYGVSSIPVSSGGSGYIDSPVVTISGGSGSGATAIAQINYASGAVTNILVTCPGTGYSNGDGLSISLTGGGGTGASAGSPTFASNTGGGLTKYGAGVLTLTGANTYSGATIVSTGQVLVTTAHQVTGSVTVSNYAGFGVIANSNGTATVGNLTLGSSATGTNLLVFIPLTGSNPTSPLLQAAALTVNGTNVMRIAGQLAVGTFPVLKYTGAVGGTGVFMTNVIAPQGVTATLSNSVADSTLYVNVSSIIASGLTWTGTNSTAGLTNVWGVNTVTNWLIGSTPTFYREATPPGDAVIFNDSGSGTVLISNTVSPLSLTISNNTVNYTFQGSGKISGTTGIIKRGSGSAVLSLTGNNYTGDTVISNGVLQLGSATAIPGDTGYGNLSIGSTATLDLNGFSSTVNGLFGSGTVNNSSGTAVALTVGGAADGVWAGMITNTGTGGISLTKTGTNTLTVTGTNYLRSGTASQINGGAMILTNGSYAVTPAEFWIGQGATTGTVIVAGGTLISSNWLVIGRNTTAGNGTLIVNSGTVQKAGGNNIVVGSRSASGKLIVNGGQVLNNGNLWLGENALANGTLYLNGGLVQATQVRFNGTTPALSVLYFNGGTLQATASSTNYIDPGVTTVVQDGGATIDDGGNTITLQAQLQMPYVGTLGSFIKKGSGALYYDGSNAGNPFNGTTVITNGTLAGVGTFVGPVVVGPAGNIGAGDAGTNVGVLTISGQSLTVQGNATFRIKKNGGTPTSDLITGISTATYGGTLVVSNITSDGTVLTTNDTFTLFSAVTHVGGFTNIVGSPGTGLAYSFTNGVLGIVTGIASNPTNITFSVSGSTMSLSWPSDHLGWFLQVQTNTLTTGLSTNWFDVPGSDSVTSTNITVNPASPTVFYRLRHP